MLCFFSICLICRFVFVDCSMLFLDFYFFLFNCFDFSILFVDFSIFRCVFVDFVNCIFLFFDFCCNVDLSKFVRFVYFDVSMFLGFYDCICKPQIRNPKPSTQNEFYECLGHCNLLDFQSFDKS